MGPHFVLPPPKFSIYSASVSAFGGKQRTYYSQMDYDIFSSTGFADNLSRRISVPGSIMLNCAYSETKVSYPQTKSFGAYNLAMGTQISNLSNSSLYILR
jgi:hypothetical protein